MTLPSAVDAFIWWCVDNMRRWARRRTGEKGEAIEHVAVPSGTAERAEIALHTPLTGARTSTVSGKAHLSGCAMDTASTWR